MTEKTKYIKMVQMHKTTTSVLQYYKYCTSTLQYYKNFFKKSKYSLTIFAFDMIFLGLIALHNGWAIFDDPPLCIFAITAVVLSMELSLIFAYFFKMIAIYMIMLLTVMKNSIRFLISTIVILLGFSYSLLTLIDNYTEFKSQSETNSNQSTGFFKSISLGFTRTFIMTAGELNSANLYFDYIMTYIVVILFIFTVSIVLVNLLNGLALDDVRKIRRNAEYKYRKFRLGVLCDVV